MEETLIFLSVVGGIILLILYLYIKHLIATEFKEIAIRKGYNGEKYYRYAYWLELVGYLIVIGLVPKNNTAEKAIDDDIQEI